MFKKSFAIFAVLISPAFASNQVNYDELGNWTQTFKLIDGSVVVHTPAQVSIGMLNNKESMEYMSSDSTLSANAKVFDNMALSERDLDVGVKMTKEEFTQALVNSGVYKK